jgi:hypothetical protein
MLKEILQGAKELAVPIGISIGLYVFREPLEQVSIFIWNKLRGWTFRRITVDILKNPRISHAFKKEFLRQHTECYDDLVIEDGHERLEFVIPDGTHIIDTESGKMILSVDDKKIVLMAPKITITSDKFKECIKNVYDKHCSPDKLLMFFTSNKDGWNPLCRRPRDHDVTKFTDGMKNVISSIDEFVADEGKYADRKLPYNICYLSHGATGTGKSTLIEIIASKHNREVFILSLNVIGMTDNVLIDLVSRIPPYSILCIDEIDKQLKAIEENEEVHVGMGGILTAISGPQRLSHGVIIMMTASNKDFVEDAYKDEFFRRGRADHVFELTEVYNP